MKLSKLSWVNLKKILIKIDLKVVIAIFTLISCLALMYSTSILSNDFTIQKGEDGKKYNIDLPFHSSTKEVFEKKLKDDQSYGIPEYLNNTENTDFVFTLKTIPNRFSQNIYRIGVDDCLNSISVNGTDIDFSDSIYLDSQASFGNNNQICEYGTLNNIDFTGYLIEGQENVIKFNIENKGSGASFALNHSFRSPIFLSLFIILSISILYISFSIFKWLKIPIIILFPFFASLILRQFYLYNTDYFIRSYDLLGTGHWGYIQHILEFKEIPSVLLSGWQYSSPPFYYLISSYVIEISRFFNVFNPQIWLQNLSIFLFMILYIYAIKFAMLYIKQKKVLLLASSLILFFPSSILHSIRISNDIPFYLTYIISLYHLNLWWNDRKKSLNLYKSSFIASVGILFKLTALTNIALIILVFSSHLIKQFLDNKKNITIKKSIIHTLRDNLLSAITIFIIIIPISGIIISRNLPLMEKQDFRYSMLIVGNIGGLNSALKVGNSLYNYTSFNYEKYMETPYAQMFSDRGGRQHFWITFLKTANFGEFNYIEDQKTYAQFLNLLILIICIYLGYLLLTTTKADIKKYYILISSSLVTISFIFAYSLKEPYSANMNFRFILPIYIPNVLFIVSKIRDKKSSNLYIHNIIYLILIIYSLISIMFYAKV